MAKLLSLRSQTVALMHQNEFLLVQIRSRDGFLVHQRMVDRKAEKKFFAKKRFDLNVRIAGYIADQGQIDFVLLELTDELVGGLLVKD